MGNITISKKLISQQRLAIDSLFILEYLPFAPDIFVKVYIMGYYLSLYDFDSSMESIAAKLFTDVNIVQEAYLYWQEQDLIAFSLENQTIEYLPIESKERKIRKHSKEKYQSFNEQLHALFPHRNFMPNEYEAYYNIIEDYNFEVEAMLTIIGYCKKYGEKVSYNSIVKIAKSFANEGCITFDKVNKRINELDIYNDNLRPLLNIFGRKSASFEDKQLYEKWTNVYNFNAEMILHIAKNLKSAGMQYLDTKLTKYYELHLTTLSEIENYEKELKELYTLTKKILQILSLHYERQDYIIEKYTKKWLEMGFDSSTLIFIAEYSIAEFSFKTGAKMSLEIMDNTVKDFYKKGCITIQDISEYISGIVTNDNEIKEILDYIGIPGVVSKYARNCYNTWTNNWKMSKEIILYAVSLSKNAEKPLPYLHSILSTWHDKGISTVEQAKKEFTCNPTKITENRVVTKFTADEINAAFAKLNEEL